MYRKLSENFAGTAITVLILAGYAACLYSFVTGSVQGGRPAHEHGH